MLQARNPADIVAAPRETVPVEHFDVDERDANAEQQRDATETVNIIFVLLQKALACLC